MPLTTAQIQNAYVAFFNRPADVAGLQYWSTYAGSTGDLLNTFAQSNEYKGLYANMNSTQIVNAVYQNLFGRAPEVSGLNYWVGQLDNGKLAIGNIADAINKGSLGTDATIISNKVTAATSFTNGLDSTAKIVAYAGVNSTGLTAVKNWLAAVTSDAATLTSATSTSGLSTIISTVQSNVATTGSTFTLTTALDNPTATSGDDVFLADNTGATVTLSGADQINGGSGTDTLKVYTKTGVANTLPSGMSSVEKLWINGTDQAVDTSAQSGVTSVELNATIAAAAVTTTVAAGQAVTLSDQAAAATYTVTSAAAVTSQALAVSAIGTTASATVALTGTGVTSVSLASNGTLTSTQSNTLQLRNLTGVKVDTISITGAAALDLTVGSGTNANEFASGGIKSIDASAATGNVKVKINSETTAASHTDLAAGFSYKAGTGNDTLDLSVASIAGAAATAAQVKAMTIDMGAGTDTVVLSNTVATGTTSLTNLTGVEKIGVNNANGTVNMANFNGATGVVLQGTAAGGVTVNALAAAATLDQGVSIDGGNALTINAAGTATSDTLAWSVGSASAALGANTGAITINGYETITLTSQGAANTLGAGGITLAASAGGNETLNIVATKDLSLAGALTLSGATTAINISGAGNVAVTGVITAGSLTDTGTGTFTATGANKVLNADFGATTKTVSFTDSAATSAAILKGGSGDTTFVGSGFNDVITVNGGTNTVTGGGGADSITINHGTSSKATGLVLATPATDTGTATGFAASTAVPTAAFSTTTMDVVTGFKAGDTVTLTGLTMAGTLLTNSSTTGAATAGDAILVKGTYSSAANTFTASTSGTDSALVYDSNGTTAAGTYQAVILVGYVDAGGADTMSAGGVFTAVA